MKISITRRGRRNELRCRRSDGTLEIGDLGPSLPFHDLAHFVVERGWNLGEGFYGNIARGYTIAQLSDKEIIRALGPQSLQAEVLTRAVQSLCAGACGPEQFAELVNVELEHWRTPLIESTAAMAASAAAELNELRDQFNSLGDGQSLQLEFEPPAAGYPSPAANP